MINENIYLLNIFFPSTNAYFYTQLFLHCFLLTHISVLLQVESNVVPLRQELNRVKEAHSKERMGRLSAQQEISVLKDQVMRLEKINEGGLHTYIHIHTYIHTYIQIYAFNLFNILRFLYVPICSYSIVYTYLHHTYMHTYIHMYIYK